MKLKSLAAALVLAASAPAMACTESFSLGVMGPPALGLFGNDFGSTGSFEDCYSFTLNGAANSFGLTFELDGSARRDIDLTGVILRGSGLDQSIFDPTATTFSFANLLAGTYEFVVTGNVTGRDGGLFGGGLVGYGGTFATTAAASTSPGHVAPVPEPQTYAMLALGLVAVGWSMRRRTET